MTSFKNIDIQHYQTCTDLTDAEALTICLNSLHKLEEIEEADMKNYIIYIDEVKAFLEMTHNKTLDSRLKQTMEILMNFIDNAAKVIVSDAIIDDNCFEFLKNRNNILFIENAYQKYKDIEAIRLRNEHDFRDALMEHCEMGKPFLFGCDSKDTVSSLFHYCQKRAGDDKNDKFLLITDEYRGTLDNASELFKDKFVFYSPKITFGVDFSISEKQDVFIYIKGGSIQPHGMFQQATRCRNIDKLYYYGEVAEQSYIFNNIEEAKDDIREGAKMTEEFKTACTYLDERNKVRIIENTFFNLFCYNEYVMDCYRTNKLKHFELILIKNGMTLSEKGEPVRMNKKTKEEMHTVVQSIKEELFEQFLKDDDKTKAEYKQIRDNLEYLKLTHKQCEKHKDIIIDKYKIEEHDNIIRLLKTDDYISRKLERCTETAYDEAVLMSVFSKIRLVRQLEHTYNINLFNLNVKNIDIDMNEQLYKNIRTVFKTTKGKPKDTKELVRLYVGLIRNICGGSLIKAKQLSTKEERNNVIYTLVADNIYYNLELNSYKNKRMTDFIDAVNVEPHRKAERVEFLDKLLDG
jgi:hypothetical protein